MWSATCYAQDCRPLLRHSIQPVQVKLNPAKKHAVDALLELGFRKRRTLLAMELQID